MCNEIDTGNMQVSDQIKMKSCKECCHEIREEATKCNECGSFQDWRRFVNLVSLILGLILAIASIVVFIEKPITLVLKDENPESKIYVSVLESDRSDKMKVLVTNVGNGSATVYGGWVVQKDKSKKVKKDTYVHLRVAGDPILIESKKSNVINLVKLDVSSIIPKFKYIKKEGNPRWVVGVKAINAKAQLDEASRPFYAESW